jgi:hypothetical protein
VGAFDKTASTTGTNTVPSSGFTALGPGSSGAAGVPGSNVTIVPEFRVVAATGSFAAGATIQVPRSWAAALVTYRAVAAPTPTASPTALVIDAFHCFTAKTSQGAVKFSPRLGVRLVSDFDDMHVDVPAPLTLCAPTDSDGGGIADAATHIERYKIKVEPGTPKHVRRVGLRVDDQLGTTFLDTVKPESLMIPTAMDLVVVPPPPDAQQYQLDHYECYAVKTTKGTAFPKGLEITTAGDAFTPSARRYFVRKPTRLCTPVDQDGGGRRHPDHLLCYQVKATTRRCADGAAVNGGGGCARETDCGGINRTTSLCIRQGTFAPVSDLRTANQFGPEQLDADREHEICLPSLRTP